MINNLKAMMDKMTGKIMGYGEKMKKGVKKIAKKKKSKRLVRKR